MKIKCVCGYESDPDHNLGDEDFIVIEGSILRVKEDDFYVRNADVQLVACPKCDTVKMARK